MQPTSTRRHAHDIAFFESVLARINSYLPSSAEAEIHPLGLSLAHPFPTLSVSLASGEQILVTFLGDDDDEIVDSGRVTFQHADPHIADSVTEHHPLLVNTAVCDLRSHLSHSPGRATR